MKKKEVAIRSGYSHGSFTNFPFFELTLNVHNPPKWILLMLDVPRCLHSTDILFFNFYLHFRFKTRGRVFFGRDRNDVVGIGCYGQILNLLRLGLVSLVY